jgi:hypothetical protein
MPIPTAPALPPVQLLLFAETASGVRTRRELNEWRSAVAAISSVMPHGLPV